MHDRAVDRLVGREERSLVIAATERAADAILPPLIDRLEDRFPDLDIQFHSTAPHLCRTRWSRA